MQKRRAIEAPEARALQTCGDSG